MKSIQQKTTSQKTVTQKRATTNRAQPTKIRLYLPPGTDLNDIFMDGQQVIQQLFIHKRTLLNWRTSGKISYTDEMGKIFYFKQELAAMMIKGRKRGRKKPKGKR